MTTEPVIKISNLKKSFVDGIPVLQGINLEIFPGQIIGYIGPNGAGKTTTVKILNGLISEFEGEVTVFGQNIKENPIEIKKKFGYIPENAALYDTLTPREFLSFICKIYGMSEERTESRIKKMLSVLGLGENVDQRISTFSKGMRQKVLIIAGLIHDPEVIFLDEPLNGLDANSTVIFKQILIGLKEQGKTIFYCSHLMDVVERISDRIVIIDKGIIIADGPFEKLKTMNRGESLEKIFTKLTSSGEEELNAQKFIDAFQGE